MDIFECLMQVGFTKHESALYLTLCKEGELTGYEASKISGIPRSNAYLALAGLAEKGGAFRMDSDSVKYMAVPAKELVSNLREQQNEIFTYIEKNVPQRETPKDPYITIRGKNHILNKMRYTLNHALERVYISASIEDIRYVMKEITAARDRGLKVVVITSQDFRLEGIQHYYHDKQPGQIRLIADSSHVITGEISEEADCTCLFSKNRNLIQLIKDSLTNEIKLISKSI